MVCLAQLRKKEYNNKLTQDMREIYSAPTKMKQLAGIAGNAFLSAAMIFSGAGPPSSSGSVRDYYSGSAWGKCNPDLWKHVHGRDVNGVPGPDRLQIIKPCKTVTGIIEEIEAQEDGDYHVLLRPDPAHFDILLDPRFKGNIDFQDGNLVTEPICAVPILDSNEVKGVCENFSQEFDIEVGQHVEMTGSYVLDNNEDHPENQQWLEIHPITSIRQR